MRSEPLECERESTNGSGTDGSVRATEDLNREFSVTERRRPFIFWHGVLGSRQSVMKLEKLLDSRHLQRAPDAVGYSHQGKASAFLLMVDVGANQRANASRIDVRDRR